VASCDPAALEVVGMTLPAPIAGGALPPGTVIQLSGARSKRRRVFLQMFPTIESFLEHHPTPGPFHLETEFPMIAVPVDEWSSTRLWLGWYALLTERLASDPQNPNYKNCLTCAETLLDWRETIPVGSQFWDED
jgi:hypothetical protein